MICSKNNKALICLLVVFCSGLISICWGQDKKVMIGAYYFDGWTGAYQDHITPALTEKFPEREPIWGWKTSSQDIMNKQIDAAANAGLSFFNFLWYFYGGSEYKKQPLNHSLGYFINAPNKSKLKFNITVVNHAGFDVGPKDWDSLSNYWLEVFENPNYLKVEKKPLIVFYDMKALIAKFGSPDKVKQAFNQLKDKAKRKGLPGVTIGFCTYVGQVNQADACGADLVTGYNYHAIGFVKGPQAIPIAKMQQAEQTYWNQYAQNKKLKYIPTVTLGWDPRPWATKANGYGYTPYYKGYSANSVYNSVKNGIKWIKANGKNTPKERILLLYAWNENGEGAWLTPGKTGLNPLEGVSKAVRNK